MSLTPEQIAEIEARKDSCEEAYTQYQQSIFACKIVDSDIPALIASHREQADALAEKDAEIEQLKQERDDVVDALDIYTNSGGYGL